MSDDRMNRLLRDVPLPDAERAEERGMRIVRQAYAERRQRPRRKPLRRLAVVAAAGAVLAAVVLSPAGAAVRSWVGDIFSTKVPAPQPVLKSLPGGGDLLVRSSLGPWVVHADGSRRLLGRYDAASWSPHGLYVAVASGPNLTAVEPDGTPHWSVTARARVSDPRWAPSGLRIAYRAGRSLHVIAANGTSDRAFAETTAPVAPAWYPTGQRLLAYVARGRLVVVDAGTGRRLAATPAMPGVRALSWTADGSFLLEQTARGLWAHDFRPAAAGPAALAPSRRVALPAGSVLGATAVSPHGNAIAALVHLPRASTGRRTEIILLDPRTGAIRRRAFGISGKLSGLAWSPNGRRLLTGWPEADEWLFIPVGKGRIRAVGEIGFTFFPGARRPPSLPEVDGWCCSAPGSGG